MSAVGTLPITLVTATPGVGKTAMIVSLMQGFIEEGRPIFCNGIPELKLPHFPVPPIGEWTEVRFDPDVEKDMHYFTFPPKSVIVLDEAQRIYRPRPTGAKVPPEVAAFETVRHTGVTFIMSTQHPDFIDSHIRKLVGQHIHLRDAGVLGRRYYEWPEVGDPKQFATAPIKKKYKLPKKVFSLYKSSSMHIKRQYNVPPVLVLLICCVLALAGGGYYIVNSIKEKVTPQQASPKPSDSGGNGAVSPAINTRPAGAPADAAALLVAFSPVVPGRPETAPAYDQLRQVKQMPVIVGGMCTPKKCICYTQQGTNAGLDSMQCKDWIDNRPFDPYADPVQQSQTVEKQSETVSDSPSKHEPVTMLPGQGYGVLGGRVDGVRAPGAEVSDSRPAKRS